MKVLSLMQPWATLVVMGLKTIETRNWATDYRGPLFIHASKSTAGKSILPLLSLPEYFPAFEQLPLGAIIGEVQLIDIVRGSSLNLEEAIFRQQALEADAFGDYSKKFCWLFSNAVTVDEPIPATGRLGLWEF